VRAQHEEAQRLAVVGLQHVGDGEEVAQRLGHLLVVDVEEAVVHPHVDEAVAVGTLALRDLVLVVRELQVHAAAVDVEVLTQQAHDIAEHSMCQPGRPAPKGLAHFASSGSLGLAAFHSTKSSGSCLSVLAATRSPARSSSSDLPDSRP
jgi:hypothetical protein